MNTSIHSVVSFGEMLWDLLPSGAQPGGAPMNVAYHLSRLEMNPAFISRVGVDDRGKELISILKQKGISPDFVQLDYDTPTGIVHARPNEQGEMQYEIAAPAAWDHIAADEQTMDMVRQAGYFIYGSLVTRHPAARNTLFALLEVAQTKVLDINLRAPFFNRSIVEQLLSKADILKMNIAELELVTGWFSDYRNVEERMALIQERFQVPTIIVTMGAEGAIMNLEGKTYRHQGFRVQVADTVGSGDAFLAALLSKLIRQSPPEEALAFAGALGALVASKTGGCPEYSMAEIQEMKCSH